MPTFDALIIGGGPAGSTAAILLAEAGWSVGVVERQSFPRRKVCGEYLSATNWPLLARLGIANEFANQAGPPVRRTAIFAGCQRIHAPLPRQYQQDAWGRSLSREHLDSLLLAQATTRGAMLIQPARCVAIDQLASGFRCSMESIPARHVSEVTARIVIAAHGSWEIGRLATERQLGRASPIDWLAFKAHFRNADLPTDLMPLLSFQDGYGGMVHVDGGRASLSCCIRHWRLDRLSRQPGSPAGKAVLEHILDSCPTLQPILKNAALDGPWLSAGPIQPGIRPRYRTGVFVLGNAAGEAHPVVAEGISMAMQSAWLLAELLGPRQATIDRPAIRDAVGRAYSSAWRRAFAPRIRAAAAIAQWASRPRLVRSVAPLLQCFPALVTSGARLSGKSRLVVGEESSSNPARWCQV